MWGKKEASSWDHFVHASPLCPLGSAGALYHVVAEWSVANAEMIS